MYITLHHFVFGYSDQDKAKEIAKDRTIDDLVANRAIDYVKPAEEAFAFDVEDPVDVKNVLDDIENKHVYGELGPLRGEAGENRHSIENLDDVDRQHGYMVTLTCHVKPGDDLFPETTRPNEVTVGEDALKTVLDFVEDDPALDGAPDGSSVVEAIAELRDDLDQEPTLEKVKEAGR